MLRRYLEEPVWQDLQEKMIFLAGPRQVGKTTLSRRILEKEKDSSGAYFLWDNRDDRRAILRAEWPPGSTTVILDELHKYRPWKRWIKGEYDKHRGHLRFLVTGSARLDIYRKGGDSLQGRYHHYRLHPFSLGELSGTTKEITPFSEISLAPSTKDGRLKDLLQYSGFPEPVVAQSDRTHRRWQKERLERFFREDVRDLENVRDLTQMQILADLLPEKVGSLLSLNALREDLEVSYKTAAHWMEILERLYYVFRIRPFTTKAIRGLKKEPKAYLWDWSLIQDPAARFENLVASHLLKLCHFLEDTEGYDAELYYLRDVDKREVDFLVTVDRKPWFAVEVKLGGSDPSPSLRYFGSRLKIPFLFQVVLNDAREFVREGIHLIPASKFLGGLV